MFEKKRWFDGLHDFYEGKDEFEIKLGLFGGDGGEGGGGTPTKGTNAINRGTVGLTAAEMNARADAQERGSREVANLSAGVTPSANFGYTDTDTTYNQQEQGDFSGTDNPVAERFVTSTEGAYRDLDRRADVGQIDPSIGVIETPFGSLRTPTSAALGAVNKFGMSRAQDIRDQIRGGGVPVTDRFGRIQGVVSQGTGPVAGLLGAFGQNTNVYTGSPSFAPATSEQLMSYQPLSQGLGSFDPATMPPSDMRRATTRATPLSVEPLDRDLMMDALMRGVNNPQPNLQLETINDPTATAFNLGRGPFTEDPAVVAERNRRYEELRGNIGAAAKGDPLPMNENMYGRGMQDLGDTLIPAQLGTYQDSSLSPQYGTVNDPTAQAGLYDKLKSGIGNLFGTSTAKGAPLTGYFKGGTGARTYYQGPGEDVRRPFKGAETGFKEFIDKINPF